MCAPYLTQPCGSESGKQVSFQNAGSTLIASLADARLLILQVTRNNSSEAVCCGFRVSQYVVLFDLQSFACQCGLRLLVGGDFEHATATTALRVGPRTPELTRSVLALINSIPVFSPAYWCSLFLFHSFLTL